MSEEPAGPLRGHPEGTPQSSPEPPPGPPEPILDASRAPLPEPRPLSPLVVLLQFVLIPLGIVAACVAVFLGLRWLVGGSKTPDELLNEVGTGAVNRRWQAAFELSQLLSKEKAPEVGEKFAVEAIRAFQKSEGDDARIRQYLALILGSLRDRRATQPLLEALPGADPKLRFNVLVALGTIRDPAAKGALLDALDDMTDPGIRKVALAGLSYLPKEEAVLARVRAHLSDPTADVKWNAALVLAAFDDDSGADVLAQMLDRDAVARQVVPSEGGATTQDMATGVVRNAVSAAARLYQERFRAPFEGLKQGDADPQVREFATEAIRWLDEKRR